jgi:hypothetical protein
MVSKTPNTSYLEVEHSVPHRGGEVDQASGPRLEVAHLVGQGSFPLSYYLKLSYYFTEGCMVK